MRRTVRLKDENGRLQISKRRTKADAGRCLEVQNLENFGLKMTTRKFWVSLDTGELVESNKQFACEKLLLTTNDARI